MRPRARQRSVKVQLAPSILSADFSRLGEEIRSVDESGAHLIHCDVMDGHYVPNLTIGPLVVKAIRPVTELPLDVHLMVTNPDELVPAFVAAGADRITVHVEACVHLHRSLHAIREAGVRPGVALNPATPLSSIEEVLDEIDLLLIMSVNPGFGGQKFIPGALERLRRARALREARGLEFDLQVDGGVGADNVAEVAEAGADIVVAGSAVFDGVDAAAATRRLLAAAER